MSAVQLTFTENARFPEVCVKCFALAHLISQQSFEGGTIIILILLMKKLKLKVSNIPQVTQSHRWAEKGLGPRHCAETKSDLSAPCQQLWTFWNGPKLLSGTAQIGDSLGNKPSESQPVVGLRWMRPLVTSFSRQIRNKTSFRCSLEEGFLRLCEMLAGNSTSDAWASQMAAYIFVKDPQWLCWKSRYVLCCSDGF